MTDVAGRDYVQALKGRRTLSGAWLLTYRLRDTVTLVNVEFEYKRETLQWILSSGNIPALPLVFLFYSIKPGLDDVASTVLFKGRKKLSKE